MPRLRRGFPPAADCQRRQRRCRTAWARIAPDTMIYRIITKVTMSRGQQYHRDIDHRLQFHQHNVTIKWKNTHHNDRVTGRGITVGRHRTDLPGAYHNENNTNNITIQ